MSTPTRRTVLACTFEVAETHVWNVLAGWGISEDTSETGTVEDMQQAGMSLVEICRATPAQIEPHVIWL